MLFLMKLSIRQTAVAVFTITFLLYLRTLTCGFVNIDDPQYVYLNPAIRVLDLSLISESFTTSYMGWWMPLTWISLAIDYRFWGLNPAGYHLTNALLHAANATLVVLIADRVLSGQMLLSYVRDRHKVEGSRLHEGSQFRGGSYGLQYTFTLFLAGLFWGIHPLRVESVAWITERKDVLSGLFSLLSLLFYLRYALAKAKDEIKSVLCKDYTFALFFFLLALFAKPVSVVIPAMFLVLDWFPVGRLRTGTFFTILAEKLPFVAFAITVAVATVYFAAGETILISLADYPLYKRLIVAGYALTEYARMSIYPFGLVHYYSLPITFSPIHYFFVIVTVSVLSYSVLRYKTYPWFLSTVLLYMLPLLPVLGFLQNGTQSHADRFSYLPSVFPSIMAAFFIVVWYERVSSLSRLYGRILLSALAALLILHGCLTFNLVGAWKNSGTLWSRLIDIRPVGRAYYYRGEYYLKSGQYPEAIVDLKYSIRQAEITGLREIYNIHALLGAALSGAGQFDAAVNEFNIAIEMNPIPNYFYYRGLALKGLGRISEAEDDFKVAGSETGPLGWHVLK